MKTDSKQSNSITPDSYKNEQKKNGIDLSGLLNRKKAENKTPEKVSKPKEAAVTVKTEEKKTEAVIKEENRPAEAETKTVSETAEASNDPVKEVIQEEKPVKKKKVKKVKKKKDPRPKGKKSTFIFAIIVSFVIFLGLIGVGGAGYFAYKLCEGKPELHKEDLIAPDSSIIFDAYGEKIMELGTYLRESIKYEEMPNCLIDAFLSIEDSRFFEHIGFDVPRFTKAILINLRSRDFSQGGSTITMQLIKNTYFSIDADEESVLADREGMSGIKRKMQEIVLALELELGKEVSKQDIIAMYINKINYGNNIRGVQKAAEYYFGKNASDLNIGESAFLAGLINSPNSYNPYNDLYKYENYYLDEDSEYLVNATNRRNEVLELMMSHGYITEAECRLYESVRIEDTLAGISANFGSTNEKYQSYIDAVIDEVEEMTGESPYKVGMNIYTNMNPYMQAYIYDMQNEAEYTGIKFPNELCQSALVLMNNQTGAVEALGGGRGETESARQFNRATSAYLNPGSSIKPIVDYALAIEKLGWATSHTFTDMPYYLYGGNILISNYDHTYYGDMLMTEALGRSQNTPAVQALAAVVDEIGEEAVVDYLNSIGFNFDYEDFDLQFAIGGNRCVATPLQMAAAHAMFMNGGRYIKPHTVNYIDYVDKDRENYVANTVGVQRISEATAYMTAYLEYYNMHGNFRSLMWYCKRDYPLYGKTGTTDWADSGRSYGIPVGATKDSWLVMQTNKYTISCWTGYDKLEEGAYFSNREYQENTKSKLVSKILDELETHYLGEYDPYKEMEMPDSVTKFTHVKGAYPYAYPSGGYETVTGYIATKALEEHPLISASEALSISTRYVKEVVGGVVNINGHYDGNVVSVQFGIGNAESGVCSGVCDISTTNYVGDTTHASGKIFFPHWYTKYIGVSAPPYHYTVSVNGSKVAEGDTMDLGFAAMAPGGSEVTVCVDGPCVVIPLG